MSGAEDILNWIARVGLRNVVWTTDLDKTVLDTWPDPEGMAPAEGLGESCNRLEKNTAGFYVITGRDGAYIDRVAFPNSKVRFSAEYHNMVRFTPGGETKDLSERPQWALVDPEMDELVASIDGLRMRKKPFMRSLHYSQVPESERPAVKQMLHDKLTTILQKLNAQTGQKIDLTDGGLIFDMGPEGQDKGVALNEIMDFASTEHPDRQLVPIYFGDSPGDIPAGKAAKAQGGIFVCVGNDKRVLAEADFALTNPTECRALFKKVSELNSAFTPRLPGLAP
jgi:trehalose-phosphatase